MTVVEKATATVKRGLAQMLKGGVIMDVVTPEHARIAEEAGTGNIVEAVRHQRLIQGQIRELKGLLPEQLMTFAKEIGAPYELVREVHETGQLPVVNFAAGGIATPADAALMMQLGSD